MRQTLLYLPATVLGIPLFGFGILFWTVLVSTVVAIAARIRKHGMDEEAWGYLPMLVVAEALIVYVVPNVSTPDGFPIRGYGVFLLLAIVSAVGLLMYRGKKLWNMPPDTIISLSLWSVICGLVGARLFYVIEYWPEIRKPDFMATLISLVSITEGGLVVYGSIIGGTLGATVFLLKNRLPVLATLDLLAPALLLGIAIGRLGCLMNGCCFGGVCDLPWAITFPQGSPAHLHQLLHHQTYFGGLKFREERTDKTSRLRIEAVRPGCEAEKIGLEKEMTVLALGWKNQEQDQLFPVREERELFAFMNDAILNRQQEILVVTDSPPPFHHYMIPLVLEVLPVHPTQIYSSLFAAFGSGLLLFLSPRCKKDGQVFLLLITYYPIARFIEEMIRTDEGSFLGTGFTVSQNVSLAVLGGVVLLGFYLKSRSTKRAYEGRFPMKREP
ncbi:MAG: prolipoprotein diacylglyceryl transferase [Planctomycetaceae bacterium]|nr:prolipoprotein diacylglyceryl transferase [Planctomycetaceae bacterium]